MTNVYKNPAKKLDEIPNGFPATESGVELRILKKIFTPQEAQLVLDISPVPETVETIPDRLGKPVSAMENSFDKMAKKGQIGRFKAGEQNVYALPPFIPGIYEFQKDRIDKELTQLFEEYLPALTKTLGGHKPATGRVIPINTQISADLQIHRYEDMRKVIDEARSFRVGECICRKERALEGKACNHTLENATLSRWAAEV